MKNKKNRQKSKNNKKKALTNSATYVNIFLSIYSDNGNIEISTDNSKSTMSRSVCYQAREVKKEVHMTPINVLNAANYLIQLYYKTDRPNDSDNEYDFALNNRNNKKYYCSCTQIEKLLVIANLITMKYNYILFTSDMLVNTCGVGVPALKNKLFPTIINGVSDCSQIPRTSIDENAKYPGIYSISGDIDDTSKIILTDVFLKFGAYDALTLGKSFDSFKGDISVANSKDEKHPIICQDIVYKFFNTPNTKPEICSSVIYKYICEYQIHSIH